MVDLVSFNTFQVPLYATAVGVGSFISEGKFDLEKAIKGAEHLAMISPFIAPTMGWYIDGMRRIFGVKTAVQGAYSINKSDGE